MKICQPLEIAQAVRQPRRSVVPEIQHAQLNQPPNLLINFCQFVVRQHKFLELGSFPYGFRNYDAMRPHSTCSMVALRAPDVDTPALP